MNKNNNYEVNLLKDTISNLNRLSKLVACLNFTIKNEYMEYSAGTVLTEGTNYSLLLDVRTGLNEYISSHPTNLIDPLIDINEIESTYDKSQELLALTENLLDNFVTLKLNIDLDNIRSSSNSIGDFSEFAIPIIRSKFSSSTISSTISSRYAHKNQNNMYGTVTIGTKGNSLGGFVYASYVPLMVTDTVVNWDSGNDILEILKKLLSIL